MIKDFASVILQEYDPHKDEYSGDQMVRKVKYIIKGGQFGIEEGYVVMGLEL